MSDAASTLRIRVQVSPRDPDTLTFLLEAPVQPGAGVARFDGREAGAPLAEALFAVPGVRHLEVAGVAIHVRKTAEARWDDMKAPIAAAIRAALASRQAPLGDVATADTADPAVDARMLAAVRALLEARINPSIASHGGRISAERVTEGTVYLRMSGGCQGCAASQLTLRGGVERTLRSALPELRAIVDVTDHDAGSTPFYGRDPGVLSVLNSPLAGAARGEALTLSDRVRRHLESLPSSAGTASYGAIARALGLWMPGSVRRVTRALEDTMRQDAHKGRPFIAARAVSRAAEGLPGKGFFDLARDLGRGPFPGEDERAFHDREIARLAQRRDSETASGTGQREGRETFPESGPA